MPNPTILETPVSWVKNARSVATRAITLGDAVKAITGPENASRVAAIRQATAEGKAGDAGKLKRILAAVLFAGEFTRRRCDAITRHSGLMVLDFDHLQDVTGSKARLASDPHAVLCFVSPSGAGLKLVIRIEPDPAGHGASFDAARAYFQDRYGLEADPSGRDLSRLCFLSHDPAATFREHAEVLHRPHMTIKDHSEDRDYASNVRDTPPPPAPNDPAAGLYGLAGLCNTEAILTATQPAQPGQRHRRLFALARGLRFECGLADAPMPELKKIVQRWFDMARANIGTQDFTESWSDFVHAWGRVKKPLSVCAITAAWQAVQSGDMPPEADQYDRREVRELVALCWHLGRGGEFYLSMNRAGELLGVAAFQVSRWLKMLQADEVLTLVKPGTRHTAAHYRWKGGAT